MASVVCCGAATLDTLYRVPRLPSGPGKLLPTAMMEVAHGMATSAAAAVARLGGDEAPFAGSATTQPAGASSPTSAPRASIAPASGAWPAPARRSRRC